MIKRDELVISMILSKLADSTALICDLSVYIVEALDLV